MEDQNNILTIQVQDIGEIRAMLDDIGLLFTEGVDDLKRQTDKQRKENYKKELEDKLKLLNLEKKEKEKLERELAKLKREEDKETLTQQAKNAEKQADRDAAKKRLRAIELEEELERKREENRRKAGDEDERRLKRQLAREGNAKRMVDQMWNMFTNGMDKIYSQVSQAAKTYSGYVDKISTRLFGANENFASISKTISQAFGASPFFKMQSVFEKVEQAVSKGISYNIEERASMAVLSEKIADTFQAFNDNLLRLVRIQQEDSTRARLGMENLLTEFLNQTYHDTSYLDSLSKSVSANLFEASSLRSTEKATELEYVIQKYLGAFSSAGVSSSLIENLSRGIGYLASGDISSLSGNDSLQQLLVASANRGGANYGQMLTGDFQTADAIKIFTGFKSLIEDISKTGVANNVVAFSQYAKIFGMTVSDVTAALNVSAEDLRTISADLKTFSALEQRVAEQATSRYMQQRTGGASIGDNLISNFIHGAGKDIGKSIGGYLSWEIAGALSGMMKGIETGVSFKPFGVGTDIKITVGDVMKAAMVSGATVSGLVSLFSGIGSLKDGVDLSKLKKESRTISAERGKLFDMTKEGAGTSYAGYSGDFSEGALAQSAQLAGDRAVAQHSDQDYNEEKRKVEEYQQKMGTIADNVEFITTLLNETGVVIRGMVGSTTPVTRASHHTELAAPTASTIQVLFGGAI